MRGRSRRCQLSWLISVALAALGLMCGGCSSKMDPATVGHGLPDTSSTRQAPSRTLARCPLNEVIRYPDSDKPEWVVHELFAAALSAETGEKAFTRFARVFGAMHKTDWVRNAYWKAAKSHVRTYVSDKSGEDEVVFSVCRRVEESPESLKLFIGSNDPNRSNMPITLARNEAGEWKVVRYTP